MAQPELDSGYYLQHFNELLQFVVQHYQSVLTPDSQVFIDDFTALSESAQQLLVRMLNRKGLVFSDTELQYAEIGPTGPVLDELTAAGFVAPLTEHDLADFWLRLTKDTLWQLLQLAKNQFSESDWKAQVADLAIKKSQTKPLLLGAALNLPVNWLPLIAQLPQRYLVLRRQDTLNYLYFLYFGRIEANLSLFTLRDLGIRQSGQFKQQFQPRFTEASQAQLAYQLAKAKPAIHDLAKQLKKQPDNAPTELQNWFNKVSAWPAAESGSADEALQLKRSERCYQLGKLAEQCKLNDLAINFYQLSNGFPASERLVRLYYSQEKLVQCQQYLQQLLADPSCDEEWLFAEDFYRRKFNAPKGNERRSQLSQLLHDAPEIGVDELYLGQAEQGLMAHYQAQDYTVFHGENNLWLALFGLWFWHELFEHQHSALHNPFERRPRNLISGGFYQQFSSEIEQKLQQLTAVNAASTLLAAITANYGKANSLFYWHSDLAEQLMPLIQFAPQNTDGSSALAPILRAMAQDFKRHASGYPDLLLIKDKQLQFIEVKAPGDKIQRHQLARLMAMQQAGFKARIEKLQWIVDPNRIYVVLDVETTGGKAANDRVIEIGAVKVQAGEVLDTFSTLINPQRYIPSFITRLTGINSAMVSEAPTFAEIAGKLSEFLQGAVFVAHNSKFDYGFIRSEFTRLDMPFAMPQLCTVVNMRRYYPGLQSYSLGKLCEEFDIKLTNHHRALDDATATVELLKLINARRCAPELAPK
ncbi:exonuclease domain-containing protein [Arsukibacterium indicum]|uniref:DNA-directed DNA polymerase n=1 Tax=Arsukibacterium indicum TaxID=2848612 RepID=A0ABS6MJL9_9GAMM|nr:exonuclease domain-containing protein [Arsukibacterium indicum]MBV2129024.1 VRR-NUC domain-containing protein [Arsukibacterium indicum]